MPKELATKVDSLDAVAEELKDYYREDNGAFVLNGTAVGDFEIADTGKLKNALNLERKAKETAVKKAKAYEKFADVDLDAAVDALARVDELTAGNVDIESEVKRRVEAQVKQVVDAGNEKLAVSEGKGEKLLSKLRTLMVDNEAIRAINEAKGDVENLLPHVRNRVKVIETENDFGIQVLTEQGEPAVDGEAKPISISALVKGYEKKFPFAFKGAGSTGGGGAGKEHASGTPKGSELVISQEDARDSEKYRAAKIRAEKEGLKLVMEES